MNIYELIEGMGLHIIEKSDNIEYLSTVMTMLKADFEDDINPKDWEDMEGALIHDLLDLNNASDDTLFHLYKMAVWSDSSYCEMPIRLHMSKATSHLQMKADKTIEVIEAEILMRLDKYKR